MRAQVIDIQSIAAPLDEEDRQLMALFPVRRESALNDMYLVRRGGEAYLLRKEDVARMRKALQAMAAAAQWAAAFLGLGLSVYCWMRGVGNPWVWLTVGEMCLVGRITREALRR